MNKTTILISGLLLALALSLGWPLTALADGSITVDTTNDEYVDPDPGSGCSLREAITTANTDADFGGCTRSGTAPYTITVPTGTYTLTLTGAGEDNNATGDLDLRASMTIEGKGADQTIIDGNGSTLTDRVLHLPISGPQVTLSNLTIQNGNVSGKGGGIENNGSVLNIRACAISNNTSSQGGGIANRPGSIFNILDSAIAGNTATGPGGGGIDNFSTNEDKGTLNVANSTISDNSTNGDGGGIRAHGLGHSTKLTHVTISNNTADGSNGGGIKHSGGPAIQVKNNLVAGNSVGISGSGPDCHGNFSSLGYNLIGDNSGCNICFPAGNPNPNDDYVGTGISPLDPQIDGLTGNPAYHPLQADSPAIDKVPIGNCTFISSGSNPLFSDGAAVTTDQRGEPRPANVTGGGCDIGAFETQPEINVFHKNASIPNGTGSVDFGQTPVGIPLTETFTVSNTGTFTLTLTEPITVPAGFSVASSFGSTSLAAGDATTFSVRLDAAALGTYSGTLEFANNDADENPYTFTIRGEVLEMEIVVLDGGINIPNGTGSVDFGQTPMGIPLTETFTVSNTGTFTLTLIEPITVPAGFSVASSFGRSSLAAGDATTFAVRLDAAAVGTYSGTLEFANNDTDENPFNFTLEGTVAESSCYLPVIFKNP